MADGAYEERFRPTRRGVLQLLGCAAFVALALLMGSEMHIAIRVVTVVFFGGGGLVLAAMTFSRKVALRVDESGVTLGGSPLRPGAEATVVPWDEIEEVVLWRQHAPGSTLDYVGLVRGEGLPPLQGSGAGRGTAKALDLPVSAEVLKASRPVNGWSLDEEALAESVKRFAPRVSLVDMRA
jgi:hypothetical protein